MLQPLGHDKWNFATAAHLLNRAAFGGPPAEIQRLAELGPERAVASLVDYEKVPDATPAPEWAKPDPGQAERLRTAREAGPEALREARRQEQQGQRQHLLELRGWWLLRMADGPRPLQERMVLFWHGHFATSAVKVRNAYLMWRQNELFRRLATESWPRLLIEAAKDPAMLIWLDQARSRKEHPNENFAREVMELFALGEGHYTETDVTEGARALTGWSYDRQTQQFIERPQWHDDGPKTIFGRRGHFAGEDFLQAVVARPQAARFITAKLWKFFAGSEPPEAVAEALSASFRRAGDTFKPMLREMFLSKQFYAPEVIRSEIKSPVQWLVGSVRMLERDLPPPVVAANLVRDLGQDLFAPPNVKGWDGGPSWITTGTLLARYNEAATLISGDVSMLAGPAGRPLLKAAVERRMQANPPAPLDTARLFAEEDLEGTDAFIAALERRLLQSKLKPKQETVLRDYLRTEGDLGERTIRNALRLIMSTPEYQLT